MLMFVLLQAVEVSSRYITLLAWSVGLIALALIVQALIVLVLGVKAMSILTDVKKTFDETKGKTLPLIARISDLTQATQGIVTDLTPKIKTVSENVVEVSHAVRQTAAKLDVTIREATDKAAVTFAEANTRTQAQVVRVDGMVAHTLAATAELGATLHEGIRVPARKIAALVTQAKHLADTLVDRAKALNLSGAVGGPKVVSRTPKAP